MDITKDYDSMQENMHIVVCVCKSEGREGGSHTSITLFIVLKDN